jgi:hypothetical protein
MYSLHCLCCLLTAVRPRSRLRPRMSVKRSQEPSVRQWIDTVAGVAYISIGSRLESFREFLDAIDKLISHPDWRPGMPVLEDLRRCHWIPPKSAIDEWRAYVAQNRSWLEGCRWAVVRRGLVPAVVAVLDAAAKDAASSGVVLKHFTDMIEAHLWLEAPVLSHP